jgi:hypothetical protein
MPRNRLVPGSNAGGLTAAPMGSAHQRRTGHRLLRRWVVACAAAETIGMAAAAGSAKISQGLVGEPPGAREVAVSLTLAVAGGLVEGLCLGTAQSWALLATHPSHPRRLFVALTVTVAGVGWAGASLPAALSGPSGAGSQPSTELVMLGGAGLGLAMGCMLGVAQAIALRRAAARPWRWVGANAVAWVPAMAIIFLGATTPDAAWSWPAVVLLGAVTGCVAGAVLGAVLSRWPDCLGSVAQPAAR